MMDTKHAVDETAHLLNGDLHEDSADHAAATAAARRLAERYRLEFVDMDSSASTGNCSDRFPQI
jgi:hypothetical protein